MRSLRAKVMLCSPASVGQKRIRQEGSASAVSFRAPLKCALKGRYKKPGTDRVFPEGAVTCASSVTSAGSNGLSKVAESCTVNSIRANWSGARVGGETFPNLQRAALRVGRDNRGRCGRYGRSRGDVPRSEIVWLHKPAKNGMKMVMTWAAFLQVAANCGREKRASLRRKKPSKMTLTPPGLC